MKPTVVLPSYNPDEKLLQVLQGLIAAGFSSIVVVNDGSRADCAPIFFQVEALPQCTLLIHPENKGKGRALKTAFAHLQQVGGFKTGVITVDGDNQHHVEDICRLAQALEQDSSGIWLGCRTFTGADVPFRSALGNRLTCGAFRLLFGIRVGDTQTGLRGIPAPLLPALIDLEGERFEYETNMLLATRKLQVPLHCMPIRTIYIDDNATSHYRPLWDSLKIIRLMLLFMVSSLGSAVLDVGLYALLYGALKALPLSQRVFFATATARVISSGFNFIVNRNAVFASKTGISRAMLRYYSLAAVQLLASYAGVYLLTVAFGSSVFMKLIVDGFLFLLSFQIQQRWVFK